MLPPTRGIVLLTGTAFQMNGQPVPPAPVFLLIKSSAANRPLHWSWSITPARIPGTRGS